jgi:O-antigen/teichoic acid export membrane protein
METGARVFLNTLTQILGRGVVVGVSLLTTAVLTRLMGVAGYGDYVFITAFVLLFVGLSDLGITTIGVREAAKNKREEGAIFGNVLALRFIISFFLFFLLNLAILLLPQFQGIRSPAILASLVLFFLVARTTAQGVLQTALRLDLASLLEILAAVFFLAALGGLFWFGRSISLNWLMLFWLGGAFLSSLLGRELCRRFIPLRLTFSPGVVRRLMGEAWPLGIYLLVYSVYDHGIDAFIIKTFAGSAAVGYYGLAYKIYGNLILGAAFLMNSLFPLISIQEIDSLKLKRTFEKAFTVLLLSGLLILLGGIVLAPLVVKVIAGEGFIPSVLALRILLAAVVFSYLNHLAGYVMIAAGRQKRLLLFSLAALTINLGLNWLLIPRYSFLAAAGVTALTELTIFLLTQSYLARQLKLKYSLAVLAKNLNLLYWKKQEYFREF